MPRAARGPAHNRSIGGTTVMPLSPSPWDDSFGICVDEFGVTWMVNIAAPA